MDALLCAYRGCLLGLAVGDAMGYTIDEKSWDEIVACYGPNGLLGYDLQEQDYAQVTSYTQIAAYMTNGLLLNLSRGKSDYTRWCKQALREWMRSQHFSRDPEQSMCFVSKLPYFRRNMARDARMLDTLRLETFGTVDNPRNGNAAPGAITAAIAAGMYYNRHRISADGVGTLAADLIALTHGNPEAILSGVVLSYAIAGILHDPAHPLEDQFLQAIAVMEGQFGGRFPQAQTLAEALRAVVDYAKDPAVTPQEGIEQMLCLDTDQCLAGAIFACLKNPEDFDAAIVTAVNHSGISSAVGAITGAILGAKLGEYALPEFYLDSLECADVLRILAEDMLTGSPAASVFDDSWDQKYVQGLPPESIISG